MQLGALLGCRRYGWLSLAIGRVGLKWPPSWIVAHIRSLHPPARLPGCLAAWLPAIHADGHAAQPASGAGPGRVAGKDA